MIKKFAIRQKGTDKFLSSQPSYGRRQLVHVSEAHLWNRRHHASLSLNYQYDRFKDLEIVEFGVLLVDAKKGYVG